MTMQIFKEGAKGYYSQHCARQRPKHRTGAITRLGRRSFFSFKGKSKRECLKAGRKPDPGATSSRNRRTEGRMEEGGKGRRPRQEGLSDKRRAGTKDRKMDIQIQIKDTSYLQRKQGRRFAEPLSTMESIITWQRHHGRLASKRETKK